jgi:hypothetical protein
LTLIEVTLTDSIFCFILLFLAANHWPDLRLWGKSTDREFCLGAECYLYELGLGG